MFNKLIPVFILIFLGACGTNGHEIPSPSSDGTIEGFVLTSPDFIQNDLLPRDLTCDGGNISPALKWSGAPAGVKSFILTMRDPDAQGGDFLHWAVVDIPASVSGVDRSAKFPAASRELKNDFDASGYGGPCPPAGTHHYVFSLYAVNTANFSGTPVQLDSFLKAHALAKAVLTGRYKRK